MWPSTMNANPHLDVNQMSDHHNVNRQLRDPSHVGNFQQIPM